MAKGNLCVLCGEPASVQSTGGTQVFVTCERCGSYYSHRGYIHSDPKGITDVHLVCGHTREYFDRVDHGEIGDDELNWPEITKATVSQIAEQAPSSVSGRTSKVLAAIARRTTELGREIELIPAQDYPLGYAKTFGEFLEFIAYLAQHGFITGGRGNASHCSVTLTAEGLSAIESRRFGSPLTVFVSSTCYDLLDLRAELANFLEGNGVTVKLSEDPNRFDVDPTADSIESCLQNVSASDVVVCILDRRYGGVIAAGDHKDLSATHAEIRYARSQTPAKPVYTFIREQAFLELSQLRKNPDAKTFWIEPEKPERRLKWLDFAKELMDLEPGAAYSNWVTQFKTSVDLKKLVLNRLADFQRIRRK